MSREKANVLKDTFGDNKIYKLNPIASKWTINDINLINIYIHHVDSLENFFYGSFNSSLNNKYILPELDDLDFLNNYTIHKVSDDSDVQEFYKSLKNIYGRSIQEKRECVEEECVNMIQSLLRSIYQNEVSVKVARSLDIGTKVVVSENDIECYKDNTFTFSAELKDHHNQTIKKNSDYQLVVNLLTQAYFKFRRSNNYEITVFGIKVWGYKVIFYKAVFNRYYLQCLQNGRIPLMTEKIPVWKWPANDKLGLALIKKEDRKKCIQLLDAICNNSCSNSCPSLIGIERIQVTQKDKNKLIQSFETHFAIRNKEDTFNLNRVQPPTASCPNLIKINYPKLLDMIKCDICNRSFKNIKGLNVHKRSCIRNRNQAANNLNEISNNSRSTSCPSLIIIERIQNNSRSAFCPTITNINNPQPLSLVKCDICNRSFKNIKGLNVHKRSCIRN